VACIFVAGSSRLAAMAIGKLARMMVINESWLRNSGKSVL
jgi:hypothetical protein